ncbi:hypothetical protein [Aeromonas sobria]|uniref:hypothetical protein n=1 Tax=Aeromonas sobria TaxID=646 RepID=UPI0012FEB83B|nr:hypothetical protein [Aeromonas sobria]EKP0260493.1 hypothetical protein [Aeromonas sobria]
MKIVRAEMNGISDKAILTKQYSAIVNFSYAQKIEREKIGTISRNENRFPQLK